MVEDKFISKRIFFQLKVGMVLFHFWLNGEE